jgi:glycine/D-amino acid oxidase-like deaminating enzyme
MDTLKRRADAVVVGSGALGAASAFWLAKRGLEVVLVDRFELVSQTSPRAAGLAQKVQVDDVLAELAIRGVDALLGFEELTGRPLEVTVNGSVKVARTEADAEQLHEEVRRGAQLGVAIEEVDAADARRHAPWLNADDALLVSYAPGDVYIEDPGTLPRAFVAGLADLGGTALANTEVTGFVLGDGGTVLGVETSRGTIEAAVVVDAAGAWTRIVGRSAGVSIPLYPARHQLCITEPLAEVRPTHPTVRVMDARVYVRPCGGGLMFGAYEPDPLMVDPARRPPGFQIADLEFEIEPLRRKMAEVASEMPLLGDAPIAELRGGLPTMTPDGHFIVDRLPGTDGIYVASGCNVGGLSISPPIGEDLASWIVAGGDRPRTLEALRIGRFGDRYEDEEVLRAHCFQTYAHKYDVDEVADRRPAGVATEGAEER